MPPSMDSTAYNFLRIPYFWVVVMKGFKTVDALLLVEHLRNVTNLEYPSTAPWMANFYLIDL